MVTKGFLTALINSSDDIQRGWIWREVQHLRALGLTKERSDFPFLAAAFRCISKMRRRLRGKENRVGSKRWGVALRVGIQGYCILTQQAVSWLSKIRSSYFTFETYHGLAWRRKLASCLWTFHRDMTSLCRFRELIET